MFKPIAVSHREPMPNMQYGDAVYVRNGANKADTSALPRGEKLPDATELLERKKAEWSEQLKDGSLLKNAIDLTDRFEQVSAPQVTEDGKKIIDNRDPRIIVKNYAQGTRDPISANDAAKQGAPTHGFFYEDTDFLTSAAKEYSKLGDDEVFRFRHIHDEGFVRNALDFFTNGNYSEGDVRRMQDQMTDLVRELGKQVRSGEALDFSKAQTKLTVGGVDTTLSELLDMQKTGRVISEDLDHISIGTHISTKQFGQMGIAKAMGNAYGAASGELGAKFSDAVDRLYDKVKSSIQRTADAAVQMSNNGSGIYWPKSTSEVVKVDFQIADLLTKLDTSSKDAVTKDFAAKMKQADALIQGYCSKHGLQPSWVTFAGDKDGLRKYMESWLNG